MLTLLLVFAVVGVVAGLIAGLFGLGGGVVIVPALIYTFAALNFPESILTHLAVGTSLGCIVVTATIASRTHWQKGAVDTSILWP
ncbi:MAG: TSUP family transporter, partial [Pseudomonadota bacterium]